MTDVKPQELPFLTLSEAAKRAGIWRTAVDGAIRAGRLPVYTTTSDHGHSVRLVRPEDVDALWSVRKHPLTHRIDDIEALVRA